MGVILGVGGEPHFFAEAGQEHRPPAASSLPHSFNRAETVTRSIGACSPCRASIALNMSRMSSPTKTFGLHARINDGREYLRAHQDRPQEGLLRFIGWWALNGGRRAAAIRG